MRETSRKPDEIYDMIDHLAGPDVRKIELFGRIGNLRPGWMTLGNQLPGVRGDSLLAEEDVKTRVWQKIEHGTFAGSAQLETL